VKGDGDPFKRQKNVSRREKSSVQFPKEKERTCAPNGTNRQEDTAPVSLARIYGIPTETLREDQKKNTEIKRRGRRRIRIGRVLKAMTLSRIKEPAISIRGFLEKRGLSNGYRDQGVRPAIGGGNVPKWTGRFKIYP